MRLASETSRKSAVAVEAPRAALLYNLQPRFVVAIEQLVGDLSRWRLVGQLQRLGAEPLDRYDGDQAVRENAADGGVGEELFQGSHAGRFDCGAPSCLNVAR